MNQKKNPGKVVREIKRKTWRKFTAEKKMEIIRLAENSELGIKLTLINLQISDKIDNTIAIFY